MDQPAPYEPSHTMIYLTVRVRTIHAARLVAALQRLLAQKWLRSAIGRYDVHTRPEHH